MRRAAELAVGRYEIDDAVTLLEGAIELADDPSDRMNLWWEIGHAKALAFDADGHRRRRGFRERNRRRRIGA